ncbi:hypothetical protein ANCDUO_12806 [Ancylostoma duodenale]|uniref:Uncharacterized protein n=1 Tax=Ancylostoma duodenale TaxID=51022 RepID=A0A0C2G7S7_9BILA|nr:hypothetical protein ANCDUO_12806 [Ancylostoma duodenale]
MCLDAETLFRILLLAYENYTEWTEFICSMNSIEKHVAIESNCVEDYRVTFARVKEEVAAEAKKNRTPKEGPTGFAAPESAFLLEKDEPRAGLVTRVATSFAQLQKVFESWTSFGTWVVVHPMESKGEVEITEEIVKLMKNHLEAGGKLITAWTPITDARKEKWMAMRQVRMTLDAIVGKFAILINCL